MTDRRPMFGWGHINVNVGHLERSIEFYEKLGVELLMPGIPYLGLTSDTDASVIPAQSASALGLPGGTRGRACIMQLDSGFPKLDLTEVDVTSQATPLTNRDLGLVRLCLVSRDLQGDYARLSEWGVEFLSPPVECVDRLADMAVCVDPDGTLIELLQVYLDRWPR